MYRTFLKPLLDSLLSLTALLLLSPVLLVLSGLLSVVNGGQPFFFQTRPGKNGKLFRIVKFKTMNDKTDASGQMLPDGERLTRMGQLVRKSSLDELPQLINVLKGDMSLIGPRPLLVQYLPLYSAEQARRHEIRPGITGWAQVNGRNAISWEEKFRLDVEYVDQLSFAMDVKIVLKTIQKVFKREGISQAGQATMEYFTGKN